MERSKGGIVRTLSPAYAGREGELTAVLQYVYQAIMLSGCGREKEGKIILKIAIEEMRHLEKIGCLIYGEPGSGKADLRFREAREALRRFDYPCGEELLLYASETGNVEMVGKLLNRGVDALLCPGQSGGLLTAYALSLFGKRIPQDISLISTEISFFSPYSTPPQTTLNPDYPQLAGKAVEVFQALLSGEQCPVKTVLPYRLIRRESVR